MNHLSLPVIITPTRAENGSACHRKHFLGDVLNKELFHSPSLEFGSVVHAGAGAHWLSKEKKAALDWRTVIQDEWHDRFELTNVSQDNVSIEMAFAMMEYYEANAKLAGPFQDAADDWVLVDAEQRYEMPLREHLLSLQMDRVVYSKSQNWLLIGDLKTAARLDARWEKQWARSLQMKDYKLGVQTIFETAGRIDVFIEGLYKHVPSDIRYYVCPEWSDKMLGEAAFNTVAVAEKDKQLIEMSRMEDGSYSLAKAEEIGVRFTTVNYGNCFTYNSECPFYRVCTADVDERVGILRGEYTEKVEEDY